MKRIAEVYVHYSEKSISIRIGDIKNRKMLKLKNTTKIERSNAAYQTRSEEPVLLWSMLF